MDEAIYVNLVSDDDIETSEVNDGASTARVCMGARQNQSVEVEEDTICSTISEFVEQGLQCYEGVLVRRLSGLGKCSI